MIQFADVAKTFRKARGLDRISLDIGLGERVALAYPASLGLLSATIGYFLFRCGDLP